jgi:hypothetical protein
MLASHPLARRSVGVMVWEEDKGSALFCLWRNDSDVERPLGMRLEQAFDWAIYSRDFAHRDLLLAKSMNNLGAHALILGGTFTAVAALAHLICIAVGAPAYRFMGAGERMALAAEAGEMQPTLITLAITLMLFVWSAYALSGAGVISLLPFTKSLSVNKG